MVCQQHKPLHRKTISNEKSSTKDEGCINKEQKSPQLQWKRACNTYRRNIKPASAVLVLFMTKLTAKINTLSQPGNIQSNTEWNPRQHKITIDQNAHIILQRLQSKKCVENNLIKVYLCVRGIDFASFYEFDIWVWNSDSVGCVFFILLIYWTKRFRLLLFINHFSDHQT